jgi:hypothetical protein
VRVLEDVRFVMKGGKIYKQPERGHAPPAGEAWPRPYNAETWAAAVPLPPRHRSWLPGALSTLTRGSPIPSPVRFPGRRDDLSRVVGVLLCPARETRLLGAIPTAAAVVR